MQNWAHTHGKTTNNAISLTASDGINTRSWQWVDHDLSIEQDLNFCYLQQNNHNETASKK